MNKNIYGILIVLGFFVSISLQTKAQFLDDEFCGNKEVLNLYIRKKPWKGANSFLYNYLKEINYSNKIDSVRYRVPLKFWIYQSNDASIGIADSTLKRLMNELNYYQRQNKTGFRYYISAVERINKTKRLKLGYFLEAPWQTIIHKDKGCINVYLTKTIKKRVLGDKYIVRGTFNTLTNAVIIQYNTSSTGLSHEIGHYFGLLHPHRNYNKGKAKQESVSRTRTFKRLFKKGLICEKNGDGLADTPAEPKLSHLVDNDCNFIGNSLKDRWGDNYQSQTNNIMSYPTHYRCRKIFTEGQKAVMLYSASQNKFSSSWTTAIAQNNVYKFDRYEPDDSFESAGEIKANEIQSHTFHKLFKDENNNIFYDMEDWLYFTIENAKEKTVNISIITKDTLKTPLKIQILDENRNIIQNTKFKDKLMLHFNINTNNKSTYFILIENKNIPVNQAYSYQVSLRLK
ncbi:MAG: hypothetical protein L3J74_08740 [Bacteroidales bacterium]|nr:hypothetical protein [Bacteroidales bacterium]